MFVLCSVKPNLGTVLAGFGTKELKPSTVRVKANGTMMFALISASVLFLVV